MAILIDASLKVQSIIANAITIPITITINIMVGSVRCIPHLI